MIYNVPALPTLTPDNVHEYPEWHAYFKRVYKEQVRVPIDLNTFSWFYHTAPFNVPIRPRRQLPYNQQLTIPSASHGNWQGDVTLSYMNHPPAIQDMLTLHPGDAFQGIRKTITKTHCSLMCAATLYGFFVKRAHVAVADSARSRIEVVRVRDNADHECIWYWVARGSGVFVDVPSHQKLHVFPSSRRELSLYKNARSKSDFDDLNMYALPAYLKTRQNSYALFEIAHGVPELVIQRDTYPTTALPRIMIEEDVRTHAPIFVTSADASCHNAVGGLSTRYISTGFPTSFRGGKVSHLYRFIHYGIGDSPPAWYTLHQHRLVQLLLSPN
jgi:hypothetical protein